MAACELDWGYEDENGFPWHREEIARRLADEIDGFLAGQGAWRGALAQVCICGGLPELRSMAVGLMEALDVEVETLDSLFGIDTARLPEPADEFREHAAEYRLALAAAIDWPGPVNLLRERNRRRTNAILARAAIAAGVITGVGVAWQVQRSDWWRCPVIERACGARRAGASPSAGSSAAAGPGRSSQASAGGSDRAQRFRRPPPVVEPRAAPRRRSLSRRHAIAALLRVVTQAASDAAAGGAAGRPAAGRAEARRLGRGALRQVRCALRASRRRLKSLCRLKRRSGRSCTAPNAGSPSSTAASCRLAIRSTARGSSTSRRRTCFFAMRQGRLRQLALGAARTLNQPRARAGNLRAAAAVSVILNPWRSSRPSICGKPT